ncbi:DUF1176 domain-containing protein [Rouxiella badensis]|jgi:invasion protein IalB|uniref:DUF1176 domain-containing protein n=1 Tax=Rouxiella badensis TaxID=1646377 RepID=UPI0017886281|nr:DUF1176 domain-containing protein [Rouxiella badensis]MCC3719168.1 DUF1176 domain-containing protein [Rouxiella badensis]MCC3729222.1 DUF1176 domain-containing protein [Rouxiella badensis]MCC3733802.1 DUF1176 domain-containing protein [Rouxiella badensis]MCC3740789.1 DUF1176 domain-containing protein [Rouxiella badensis]MCC3748721.1 DUF1176 domain-containing protein [Rouxiella badensis]
MIPNWMATPLLLMATLMTGYVHADPLQRIYNDWQVSCDNLNHCSARSSQDSQGLVLQLTRDAGPEGRASVSIDYQRNSDEQSSDIAIANRLTLNGKTLNFNRREWDVSKKHIASINRVVVNEFVNSIRDGSSIQLSGKLDSQQSTRPSISLNGLKAALLAIDQQQSREGTKTAWASRGNKAASTVPPAPAAPLLPHFNEPHPLTDGEISAITQNTATNIENNDCSLDPSEREVHLFPLSNEKALMTVNCDMGAYNLYVLGYIVSRQAPYKSDNLVLNMPFKSGDDDQPPELINADFDEKTGILSIFDKGRGLGDCGVSSRWLFDGKAFRLAAYASEPSCDGYSKSGQWPVLWVTRSQ